MTRCSYRCHKSTPFSGPDFRTICDWDEIFWHRK